MIVAGITSTRGFTQGDFWPTGETVDGRARWCVTTSFTYSDGTFTVTVPDGFVFDGPSVPFWSAPFLDIGLLFLPAALHDFLYDATGLSKAECDKRFYQAMRIVGVGNPQAKIVYWAVKWFGWRGFRNARSQMAWDAGLEPATSRV